MNREKLDKAYEIAEEIIADASRTAGGNEDLKTKRLEELYTRLYNKIAVKADDDYEEDIEELTEAQKILASYMLRRYLKNSGYFMDMNDEYHRYKKED